MFFGCGMIPNYLLKNEDLSVIYFRQNKEKSLSSAMSVMKTNQGCADLFPIPVL